MGQNTVACDPSGIKIYFYESLFPSEIEGCQRKILGGWQGLLTFSAETFLRHYPSVRSLNVNDTHSFTSTAARETSMVASREGISDMSRAY